jgi:hypothetical protein
MKSYGLFIVGFKSRAIRSRQEKGERGHDALDGPYHVAQLGQHMVGTHLQLLDLLMLYFVLLDEY